MVRHRLHKQLEAKEKIEDEMKYNKLVPMYGSHLVLAPCPDSMDTVTRSIVLAKDVRHVNYFFSSFGRFHWIGHTIQPSLVAYTIRGLHHF